jgi:hypothetical protein
VRLPVSPEDERHKSALVETSADGDAEGKLKPDERFDAQ